MVVRLTTNHFVLLICSGKGLNPFLFIDEGEGSGAQGKVHRVRCCFTCGAVKEGMKSCSRCKVVYFCGRECQRKGWKFGGVHGLQRSHRLDCKKKVEVETEEGEKTKSKKKTG